MSSKAARPVRRSGEAPKRPTTSVLVRVWLEPDPDWDQGLDPGSTDSSTPRGYARDLRSGKEQQFTDLKEISSFLLERLGE